MGDVQRMCERGMTEKWDYKRKTMEYVRSLMLSMKQEELIIELDTLSYHELKFAVGCGVPGDAEQFAKDKLKAMRQKVKESIDRSTSFTWVANPEEPKKEGSVDGDTGVQTP